MADDHDEEEKPGTWDIVNLSQAELSRERAPYENEGPRDSVFMRWAKFASIVVVFPMLIGLGLAFEPYFRDDLHSRNGFQSDAWFYTRLKIGAAIGVVLALAYIVRCLVRNWDP